MLEVLRKRRKDGYQGGVSPGDGYRVGLAVEGGGMRGIVSAAMLCAIEDTGFADTFDAIYSCSSGAMNAAYFVGRNTWYRLSIYYDDLATRLFVDFRRILYRRPVLNIDYPFETVIEQLKPLDLTAVLRSSQEFHVAVTDVDDVKTIDVSAFRSAEDLKETLRASTWLPVAVPGTATWRGRRAVDGGVLTAHPFALARDDGCTHILSLSTRPAQPPRGRHSATQMYARTRMNRLQRGLGDSYLVAVRTAWADRRAMQEQRWIPTSDPFLLDLTPLPWMTEVKRHELRPGHLLAGARSAYGVMYAALEEVDPDGLADRRLQVIPRLTAVRDGKP